LKTLGATLPFSLDGKIMFDFLTLDAWLFSVNIAHICLPEIFGVTGCVKALCEIDFPHKTALCD
jgi:hypothetical protein